MTQGMEQNDQKTNLCSFTLLKSVVSNQETKLKPKELFQYIFAQTQNVLA